MAPVVVFPDATAVVLSFVRAGLAARGVNIPVRDQVPSPRPAKFVRVRRIGGPRRDLVTDAAMVTVECHAVNEVEAHNLAQLCRGLVNSMPGRTVNGVAVYRVAETGGPVNLPDPLSEHPRYTFTSIVHLRGAAG
jgi:hypothetical protein